MGYHAQHLGHEVVTLIGHRVLLFEARNQLIALFFLRYPIELLLRTAAEYLHDAFHALGCPLLVWCAFANGILLAVIYAVMLFIFPGLVHVFILRFHTRQIEDLNDMLKSCGNNSENPLGKTTQ